MGITLKTRKILWGRSGNRCAICRRELVVERSKNDPDAVIGEECHIISKQDSGPRSHTTHLAALDLDGYDNLLLLCRVDHKIVDDQSNKYDIETLRNIKSRHESWVRDSLANKNKESHNNTTFEGITLLPRITSGKELVNIVKGAHLYQFDNDELETQEEMEIVSGFSQSLQDYGDILIDLDISETVRAGYHLTQELNELEEMGFLIFGERKVKRMKIGGMIDNLEVATVCILRESNPAIFDLSSQDKTKEVDEQEGKGI